MTDFVPDQEKNASDAQKSDTPSQGAYHRRLLSQQKSAPVLNGRPFEYSGPPLGLYHPVFNAFEEGLKADDPIPLDTRRYTRRYIEVSAGVYQNEAERMQASRSILDELFGGELHAVISTKVESDGVILATCVMWDGYILIFEMKNEIGTGNVDPFVQASLAYQKYISSENGKGTCFFSPGSLVGTGLT